MSQAIAIGVLNLTKRLEQVVAAWEDLEERAELVYKGLSAERHVAFYEMLLVSVRLQANLNRLYASGELPGQQRLMISRQV